jgi:tRNA pseudouridine55 synthase
MISLEQLEALCHRAASGEASLADALMPVETALDDIPALAAAGQMRQGFSEAKLFCARTGRTHFRARSMSRYRAGCWPWPNWIVAKSSPSAFNLAGLMGRAACKKG